MNILIIDNYDSFTFNLYQYVGELMQSRVQRFGLDVFRNDKITVREIREIGYERIILSPGPGDPSDRAYFGVCADVLTDIGKTIPVLGVCLGMQGIAHYFGGKVVKAKLPMHGKTSVIAHNGKGVFANLPQNLEAMRYHSLIADKKSLPSCLEITAIVSSSSRADRGDLGEIASPSFTRDRNDEKGNEIMGLRHKEYPIEGIQFHPESFATEAGKKMLENFLFRIRN